MINNDLNAILEKNRQTNVTIPLADLIEFATSIAEHTVQETLDRPKHKVLRLKEAAKWLNIAERTLISLKDKKIIPSVKIGGMVGFVEQDLIDYLQQNRISKKN